MRQPSGPSSFMNTLKRSARALPVIIAGAMSACTPALLSVRTGDIKNPDGRNTVAACERMATEGAIPAVDEVSAGTNHKVKNAVFVLDGKQAVLECHYEDDPTAGGRRTLRSIVARETGVVDGVATANRYEDSKSPERSPDCKTCTEATDHPDGKVDQYSITVQAEAECPFDANPPAVLSTIDLYQTAQDRSDLIGSKVLDALAKGEAKFLAAK